VAALRGVSFAIDAGEIVGLMGANGAGKTTAFSLIAGTQRPGTGEIWFDGRRIDGRPAYTTVQTVVYRLERKKALRCVKRISNANIFEAVISRNDAQRRLVDELLGLFGGRASLVMAHLVESGQLTLDDVKEAEKALRKLSRKDKPQ